MKVFYMNIIRGRKRTPVRRFNPYLHVKWLNIAQFDLQTIADAPGTQWDRSPNVVSCNRHLAGRSAGYENQA